MDAGEWAQPGTTLAAKQVLKRGCTGLSPSMVDFSKSFQPRL